MLVSKIVTVEEARVILAKVYDKDVSSTYCGEDKLAVSGTSITAKYDTDSSTITVTSGVYTKSTLEDLITLTTNN